MNSSNPTGSSNHRDKNPIWPTDSKDSAKQLAVEVPVQPMFGAEPLMCVDNVRKRVAAMGGKPVFGWCVEHDPFNDRHQNHVVWEDDQKQLWDVTPVFGEIIGEMVTIKWRDSIEFIRDDSAVFDTKGLPSRYIATHASPHVAKACEYMNRADDLLMAHRNLEKCRYWTERANAEMKKAGLNAGWDVPKSLNNEDILRTALNPTDQPQAKWPR